MVSLVFVGELIHHWPVPVAESNPAPELKNCDLKLQATKPLGAVTGAGGGDDASKPS